MWARRRRIFVNHVSVVYSCGASLPGSPSVNSVVFPLFRSSRHVDVVLPTREDWHFPVFLCRVPSPLSPPSSITLNLLETQETVQSPMLDVFLLFRTLPTRRLSFDRCLFMVLTWGLNVWDSGHRGHPSRDTVETSNSFETGPLSKWLSSTCFSCYTLFLSMDRHIWTVINSLCRLFITPLPLLMILSEKKTGGKDPQNDV